MQAAPAIPWWRKQGRIVLLLLLTVLDAGAAEPQLPAPSMAAPQLYRIGVLAYRPKSLTYTQWQPTADYLNQVIGTARFQVVPMSYPELDEAVRQRQIAFVLTNPEHMVHIYAPHGLRAIATLMPLADGHPVSRFGGVILARADRGDIVGLADVKQRTIASPGEFSLGGNLVQRWTLLKAGVLDKGDRLDMRYTGMPHDKVVTEVVQGRVDLGFVRTGVVEAMIREGSLKPDQIRVIGERFVSGFPQRLSTELYPEWPFCALQGVPDPLVKAVSLALLRIEPDSPAAQQGGYYGFTPPGDYRPVEAIMTRLRQHPEHLEVFDFHDVYEKYEDLLAVGMGAALLISALVVMRLRRDKAVLQGMQHERETMLAARENLLSEMHDGIGANLTLALKLAQSGGKEGVLLEETLERCLLDMHLMVDTLSTLDGDLADVLGNLRYRIQPILERAGIQLTWKLSDLDAPVALTAREGLHVQRIFQEAITNVIRHARASNMVLAGATETVDGMTLARISLEDDGCGLPVNEQRRGRGLEGMRRRAAALGGTLLLDGSSGGTRVELSFPVAADARQAAIRSQKS